MPSDGNFAFRILIGRVPQPEYVHDDNNYVESNLWTPASYQQEISEVVDGEKEVQHFPVTPYEILLRLGRHCEASAFFIYVDGVLVTKVLLEKGETRLIRGFTDRGGTKEFLFALPRFARNETDRIESSRKSEVGTITIVRKKGRFVKEEYRPMSDIKFHQANKKDARLVTQGSYTMSTTKKGRYLNRTRPYDVHLKKLWKMDAEVGRLTLNYRMGHTLVDMGITLKPVDWTKPHSTRTSSTGSECSEEIEEGQGVNTPPLVDVKEQPREMEEEELEEEIREVDSDCIIIESTAS